MAELTSTQAAQTPKKARVPELEQSNDGFYENEDGIYDQIPEKDYHDYGTPSRRASNSVLSELFEESPSHAKAKLDKEYNSTKSKEFGRAAHAAILTPDVFEEQYRVKGQCWGTTGSGDRCSRKGKNPWTIRRGDDTSVLSFCSDHEPEEGEEIKIGTAVAPASVEYISEEDRDKIREMKTTLQAHNKINDLLFQSPGYGELTILWTHEETGVRCKSRCDRLVWNPRLGWVAIDLKTTDSAKPGVTPGCFGYDAAKYSYDRQASFYVEGLAAQGIPVEHFIIVAVEKTPPFDAVPYYVEDEYLERGREEFQEALKAFAACRETGRWPGYSDEIKPLRQPGWRLRR